MLAWLAGRESLAWTALWFLALGTVSADEAQPRGRLVAALVEPMAGRDQHQARVRASRARGRLPGARRSALAPRRSKGGPFARRVGQGRRAESRTAPLVCARSAAVARVRPPLSARAAGPGGSRSARGSREPGGEGHSDPGLRGARRRSQRRGRPATPPRAACSAAKQGLTGLG